jgi:hypothetical protein
MRIHPNAEKEAEEPSDEDAEFARQLGAVLRTSESPGAGFDERVRAAVRDAHATPAAAIVLRLRPRSAAWLRPRALALPPLAWGALAAGFAALVSLGTLSVARNATPPLAQQRVASNPTGPAAPPSHDTVYVVRFVLADAGARTVSLVGDFNAWAKRATPLRAAKPGVWTAQVALPAGRHEYAFLVDGKRWVADPAAERLADDFNTASSVVTVGDGATE